ncbi:MAG: hypothetical protein ACI9CA_001005, partial [Natronomonas sp.]
RKLQRSFDTPATPGACNSARRVNAMPPVRLRMY